MTDPFLVIHLIGNRAQDRIQWNPPPPHALFRCPNCSVPGLVLIWDHAADQWFGSCPVCDVIQRGEFRLEHDCPCCGSATTEALTPGHIHCLSPSCSWVGLPPKLDQKPVTQ